MTSVASRLPLSQAYHLDPDEADTMRPEVVTSHELPPGRRRHCLSRPPRPGVETVRSRP